MRFLLDECHPRKLAAELRGHHVDTVPQAGLAGVKNGELLRRAASSYDALITIDRRFAEGHAVPDSLALILLRAKSNRIESLKPLIPALLKSLATAPKGERIHVGG